MLAYPRMDLHHSYHPTATQPGLTRELELEFESPRVS